MLTVPQVGHFNAVTATRVNVPDLVSLAPYVVLRL